MFRLLHGDILSFCQHYQGEKFHALLCDPPYHLTSIVERFGKPESAPAKHGKDGAFQRASRGFMGKEWDGGDIAFRPETWHEIGKLLYPGAFGMAFGGSRTAHRMAVAIEDAGFIIHPMIGWVYGSGFPKATRVDKQVDQRAGVKREITGTRVSAYGDTEESDTEDGRNLWGKESTKEVNLTKATSPLARAWEGHRYGTQALKPALEPIIVFQKPYDGKPVENIVETGAGALNIEGGRIGTEKWIHKASQASPYGSERVWDTKGNTPDIDREGTGRWPANFQLTHSPDCQIVGYKDQEGYQINRFTDGAKPFGDGAGHEYESEEIEGGKIPVWECAEGCPARALNKQSGNLGISQGGRSGHTGAYQGGYKQEYYGDLKPGFGDSGGASRFFHQSSWAFENVDPFIYQAKVSPSERNAGLNDDKYDIGHNRFDICGTCGGTILQNPDRPSKCTCDEPRREHRKVCNPHPTLKPISLCTHLATLLLPPEEYAPRRILVPFAGVASEMIGTFQAGWDCAIGVELEKEYVSIGKQRIDYWLSQGVQLSLL